MREWKLVRHILQGSNWRSATDQLDVCMCKTTFKQPSNKSSIPFKKSEKTNKHFGISGVLLYVYGDSSDLSQPFSIATDEYLQKKFGPAWQKFKSLAEY